MTKKSGVRSQKSEWAGRAIVFCLLLGVPVLRADWVIEQDARYLGGKIRHTVGKSAIKKSIWEDKVLTSDLIADFAARVVIRVDHEKKTVARVDLDTYYRTDAVGRNSYQPWSGGPEKVAGLACSGYSYSYNSSNEGKAGGWGTGRGCYTRAITMPPPYDKMLERWLEYSHRTSAYLGFLLWYEFGAGGPPRLQVETVSAAQKAVAASEFVAPVGYRDVAFQRE